MPTDVRQVNPGSDTLILLFSVTSGHKTRELIKDVVTDPNSFGLLGGGLPKPKYLQVVGMYELIGNWDLAVFIRTHTANPTTLIRHLRREILIRANEEPFPPAHERGGQFGRFQAITVNWERSSLNANDHSPIRRTVFEDARDYERQGHTRSFVVIDATPNEERDPTSMKGVIKGMHSAVSTDPMAPPVECVYVGTQLLVVELMSTSPGATDITKFNRLIEPGIAEIAVQKYTLLSYEYDEQPYGWGEPEA